MKKKNFKIAQSILEYICVTAVFAGVSMAAFVALTQNAMSVYRGDVATYKDDSTLQGNVLKDGVSNSEYTWSNDWYTPQDRFDGQVPDSLVNNPDAEPLPVPTEVE